MELYINGPIADNIYGRCLVYIEGDAAIKQYEDAEGNNRSALNIVQRTRSPLPSNL
jgi:single-stranded DNA-binding protein